MAISLKPFRNYNEHDVVNMYAYSGVIGAGAGDKIAKGTLVKVIGGGWKNSSDPTELLGAVGATFQGTVAQRYGTVSKVGLSTSGAVALGIILHDIGEVDENGELLKFNPRKAAEMEMVLSGQTVPVLTRGIILYSGDTLGTVASANVKLYAAANGEITKLNADSLGHYVGKSLGESDEDGYTLIKLEL